MIKDIIQQVVDAEQTAQEMIDKAQQKGYDIVMDARSRAEQELNQSVSNAKQFLNNQRVIASQCADKKAQDYVATKTLEAQQFVDTCGKKVDKAVNVILESLD